MQVSYIIFDRSDGSVLRNCSAPWSRVPETPEEGTGIIILGETIPPGMWKIDRRKTRKSITTAARLSDLAQFIPPDFDATVQLAASRVDKLFAERIQQEVGPLASLHTEKRRQAEAGGGPLIADEADRVAVLANAAAQDERIANIERQRRAIKTALRAATTMDELEAALAPVPGVRTTSTIKANGGIMPLTMGTQE